MLRSSMMIVLVCMCFVSIAQSTPPPILFSKSYGGTKDDHPGKFIQTADKGYLIGGWTQSNDGDVVGFHGYSDAFLIKTDSAGNIMWAKTIGGTGDEVIRTVIEGPANTYIIGGKTTSHDGDFASFSGVSSTGFIAWIDASNGNVRRIQEYGSTYSGNGVFAIHMIAADTMVVYGQKLSATTTKMQCVTVMDTAGATIWEKKYGSDGSNFMGTLIPREHGGFMFVSTVSGDGGDVTGVYGTYNAWLVCLDDTGRIEWAKCYGGSGYSSVYDITETPDGGFIGVGLVMDGNDSLASGGHGGYDYWAFKVNDTGKALWHRAIGGTLSESFFNSAGTCDGGIIITGHSNSTDGDIIANHGLADIFTLRLSTDGAIEWAHNYGSTLADYEGYITVTRDNGYAMLGFTSGTTDDLAGVTMHGWGDIWLAKLGTDTLENYCPPKDTGTTTSNPIVSYDHSEGSTLSVFPNPAATSIHVALSQSVHSAEITLLNNMGQKVWSGDYSSQTRQIVIPIAHLPEGLYVLIAGQGGIRTVRKVSVMH